MINESTQEFLSGIKDYINLKTDKSVKAASNLVWADEFESGFYNPNLWHNYTWDANPPVPFEPYYDPELQKTVMRLKSDIQIGDSRERLLSRQAFRDVTIEMKAKNAGFWVGTTPYQKYEINGRDCIPFTWCEFDMGEVYPQTEGYKKVRVNLHTDSISETDNAPKISSLYDAKTVTADFWNKWHVYKLVIRDNLYEDEPEDSITVQGYVDGVKIADRKYNTGSYLDGSDYAKKFEPVRRMGVMIQTGGVNCVGTDGAGNRAVITEPSCYDYIRVYANHSGKVVKPSRYCILDRVTGEPGPLKVPNRTGMVYWNNWSVYRNNILTYLEDQGVSDLLSIDETMWGQIAQMLSLGDNVSASLKEYIAKCILGVTYEVGKTSPSIKNEAFLDMGAFAAFPVEANVVEIPEIILDLNTTILDTESSVRVANSPYLSSILPPDGIPNGIEFVTGKIKIGDDLTSFITPIKVP